MSTPPRKIGGETVTLGKPRGRPIEVETDSETATRLVKLEAVRMRRLNPRRRSIRYTLSEAIGNVLTACLSVEGEAFGG